MSGCDCTTSEKTPLKPVDDALDYILSYAKATLATETIPLEQALGRVVAKAVTSQINVPAWNNSAMDGYAVRASEVQQEQTILPISQRIPAGIQGDFLKVGTAARIFTGAPIPEGADSVVMQERCSEENQQVTIQGQVAQGANIRALGEDIKAGEEIIAVGTKCLPQHLGLSASVGVAELTVYRRLKVALFSSGDELVMPGTPLGAGKIYNSNQFTLQSLLESLGCEIINLGMVKDTLDATCQALQQAADSADLVLASGGVSVGEEDYVKPAVEKLGQLNLWKIAIRPGKPLAFGFINKTASKQTCPFIGAPGNPVSLFITFCIFARPFILKSQGQIQFKPMLQQVKANFDWTRPDKRREYARAKLSLNEQGIPTAELFPSRSSGVLSSLTWANGLIVMQENQTVKKGDWVSFISFESLLS